MLKVAPKFFRLDELLLFRLVMGLRSASSAITTTIINIVCGSTRCCGLESVHLAGSFELAPRAIGFPCAP